MTPSSRPAFFATPDHQPAATAARSALPLAAEMPRAMDQLAGDLSRQHLEHMDYLERMDQMWHLNQLGPPRTGAGSGNRTANPSIMDTDLPLPPTVDENDEDSVALAIATGRDFVLRPPSPDPDAMDLVPLDAAAALFRLPTARPIAAHAARDPSAAAPPTPPTLPLSPEALAQPHLAPQYHQVPSSGYDLHSWLATASSIEAFSYPETQPHQTQNPSQLQLQLEDARSMAQSFQARRHYYQSLNRLARQQQQQPPQQQPSPSMASSATSAGLAGQTTGTATCGAADHTSDVAATPVTPASLPTEPPLPAWVGTGQLRYRLSAEVAMHCPNLVHSRPRMRRRKPTSGTDSSTTRDATASGGGASGGGPKGKGISKDSRDKDRHHREHRSSTAAATAAANIATARQAVADEGRRLALVAEQAEEAKQVAEAKQAAEAKEAAEAKQAEEAEQAEKAEQKRREEEEAQKGQKDDGTAGQVTDGTEVTPPAKTKDPASSCDDFRGRGGEPGP